MRNSQSNLLQYFKYTLPIPSSLLDKQFQQIPLQLQNQQNFHQVQMMNNNAILTNFTLIVQQCASSFDWRSLPKAQVASRVSQYLKNHSQQSLNFNIYASEIERVGYLEAPNFRGNNQQFMAMLLNNFAKSYLQSYQVYYVPNPFLQVIDRSLEQGPNYNSNSQLSQQQQSANQINRAMQVDLNARILREKFNKNQFKHASQAALQKQMTTSILSSVLTGLQLQGTSQRISTDIASNLRSSQLSQNKVIKTTSQMFPPYNPPNNIAFGKTYSVMSPPARNQESQKFNTTHYQTLTFYQYHMLDHILNTITLDHLQKIERNPYIQFGLNSIGMAMTLIKENRNSQFGGLLSQVYKDLEFGASYLGPNNPGSNGKQYYEIQSWMIVLVHIYKSLADNYDPYRRRILKLIFTYFENPDLENAVECLRSLESQRMELQSGQSVDQVIEKYCSLILQAYENRNSILEGKQEALFAPKLGLINLSQKNLPRKKTVNIWISGFLSEDMDKKSQWSELLSFMPNSQVYALQWQSDTIINLAKFMGKSCFDILTAKKMSEEIQRKFKNNPFIPAMAEAKNSGRYLAEVVVKLFPCQFVNIAGYSLGSELIKSFVERLIQINKQNILSNVYMMGGVTDSSEIASVISKSRYPLCIYNCYTANDMVLSHVLSLCLPDNKPIGLQPIREIEGHEVVNVDVSDFISGHLSYMSEFDLVGKVLEMNKE